MDKRIKNKSSSCISDNSPLSNMPFANIFSKSVVCFILLTLSFTEQNFLILTKSNSSIISFMNQAFAGVSKKASPCPSSPGLSTLSSRSFYIWPMIHFELAFVKVVRSVSRSCLFVFFLGGGGMWMCNCSIAICWKDYFYFTALPSLLWQRSADYI